MKKLFLLCLLIPFMLGLAWHTANQATIGWDAVAKVKPGDTYRYLIYQKNIDGTNPQTIAVVPYGTETFTVTFTSEGRHLIGVGVERTVDVNDDGVVDDLDKDVDGNLTVMTSDINWSDVNGVWTPNPFGLQYFVKPDAPPNLHVQ